MVDLILRSTEIYFINVFPGFGAVSVLKWVIYVVKQTHIRHIFASLFLNYFITMPRHNRDKITVVIYRILKSKY